MRSLAIAALLLAVTPVAAYAQFQSAISGDLSSNFGSGGGNDTSDQFIGNRQTADGAGRDYTREAPIRSNSDIALREYYPTADQTRLFPIR